jgi:hypothetical protein
MTINEGHWGGWGYNVYSNPEACGLKIVRVIHNDCESYHFDMTVIWEDIDTGKFYKGSDSGCSCPIPFDDFYSLADMIEISEHDVNRIES